MPGRLAGIVPLLLRLALGHARRRPRAVSVAERLATLPRRGLPIRHAVEIRWNDHLIPFIAAESDRDLATALGLVHAHLRLAQIELLRRIARGRLAEILGAAALPFDHSLRVLDPTRAVAEIERGLPDATRDWLEGFVAGINHALAASPGRPAEFELLGIAAEPWRVRDVLDIARLAAADVNWLVWLRLLRVPRGPDWPAHWAELLEDGFAPLPNLGGGQDGASEAFARLVLGLGRAGSNALAVAARRSASGGAWLAGDPHLSLSLPSIWLQAAYRSPSYNLAGLMIPGIPVMAIGRNPWIAWGGTNLHAGSSELFDISELPATHIAERQEHIAVRWAAPRQIVCRDSPYGPVISDAPLFAGVGGVGGVGGRRLALRWIGHQPSDELSALLAVNRARNWDEFRGAAAGFAVPGQHLVFADSAGRTGRLTAARLPRRPPSPPGDIVSMPAAAAAWRDQVTAAELPAEFDPPRGFVVSANERPANSPVPVGWFFSPPDRVERLAELLRATAPIGFAELAALQRDVSSAAALRLRDRLLDAARPSAAGDPLWRALSAWDGVYAEDSIGALAFELVLARLVEEVIPPGRRALVGAVWHGRRLLSRDLDRLMPEQLGSAVAAAAGKARATFGTLGEWGAAHRLRLAHPLGAIPALGRRYRFIDWPWPGSSDTVFKSAHGPVAGRHAVAYGSNARYVFDLSDPDANHLVLLGGQDGALGSAAFLDQAEPFRRGAYIRVPLSLEAARATFPYPTMLEPAG